MSDIIFQELGLTSEFGSVFADLASVILFLFLVLFACYAIYQLFFGWLK